MRNLILILIFFTIITSCTVIYGGHNLDNLAKKLELGMSKQEAIKIMGNNYFVELSTQAANERIEILHFNSISYNEYLLHFVNGELFEFHKYTPPIKDVYLRKEEIHRQ